MAIWSSKYKNRAVRRKAFINNYLFRIIEENEDVITKSKFTIIKMPFFNIFEVIRMITKQTYSVGL